MDRTVAVGDSSGSIDEKMIRTGDIWTRQGTRVYNSQRYVPDQKGPDQRFQKARF